MPFNRVRHFRQAPWAAFAAAVLLALAPASGAEAHAILLESQPAVRGAVPAGTMDIWLRYNSRIDAARSRLLLLRTADRSQSTLQLDGDTSSPDRLAVRRVQLAPGDYTLRWQVLATDGHITRGDVPFRVTPPSPPAAAAAAAP